MDKIVNTRSFHNDLALKVMINKDRVKKLAEIFVSFFSISGLGFGFEDLEKVFLYLVVAERIIMDESRVGTPIYESEYPDMDEEMRLDFLKQMEILKKFYKTRLYETPLGEAIYITDHPEKFDETTGEYLKSLFTSKGSTFKLRELEVVQKELNRTHEIIQLDHYFRTQQELSKLSQMNSDQRDLFQSQFQIFMTFYIENVNFYKKVISF